MRVGVSCTPCTCFIHGLHATTCCHICGHHGPTIPNPTQGGYFQPNPGYAIAPAQKGQLLTLKKIIIDCGKELNRDGEFNAMIINPTLLSIAMDELNDTNKPCLTQMRVIEHWWDGIGKWKAYMINS